MDKKRAFLSILLLLLFTSSLFGKSEKVMQIVASNIEQNGSIITASGDVLIFSPNYYITSQKVIYDRNNSTMELFNNVHIVRNQNVDNSMSLSNYAFLNFADEITSATPILLIDKKSNVWINAKEVSQEKHLNKFKEAMISSCDCEDPVWSIGFSSGDYNEKEKWVNTYNNTLYVQGYPLWYLVPLYALYNPAVAVEHVVASLMLLRSPYFGFSTDDRRRSGLLKPKFGYSSRGGYSYAQPFYYAPKDNYDIEYIPQIQQNRGKGHELKYRYADSRYSYLNVSMGTFYEKDSYYKKYNLLNKKHYGYDIKYDRRKLFSTDSHSDGLYFYLQDMNDIEYINTKYDKSTSTTNRMLESELTYFYNTDNFNYNISFEQFDDISKSNNDDAMQVRPSLQLHGYSQEYFDLITSSIDIKYRKKYRKVGLAADTFDMEVPFSYSQYILNKYLLFKYTKQFVFNNISYTNNDTNKYQNGELLRSKDIFSLELDLLKPYDSFLHTINFTTSYTIPKTLSVDGDFYGLNSNENNLSIFPYTNDEKTLDFTINQSFYGKESLDTWLNHKVKQPVLFDDNGSSTLGNLENEIKIYFPYTTLSNNLLYNHDDDKIIKSSYALRVKKDNFFTNVDYSYSVEKNQQTNSYNDGTSSESITTHMGNKVLKYYTISYKDQRNLTDGMNTLREYALAIDKRCWKLDLKLSDSLVASATTTNNAVRQDIIYATITLKPLASVSAQHVFKEREE
jgi:LPS-assembly protein